MNERERAQEWLAQDPDPVTRAELAAVLDAGDEAGLAGRFGATLEFGTAGLRGELGAGPNRMNRVTVMRAAAGLGRRLLDDPPSSGGDAAAGPASVVVGYDARHNSRQFALDSVAVLTGMGVRAWLLPRPLPTPVLAYAVRHLGAAAGVMVTASHNPPRDNGYKVYWADGTQIVPPVDREISDRIAAVGPVDTLPLGHAPQPRDQREPNPQNTPAQTTHNPPQQPFPTPATEPPARSAADGLAGTRSLVDSGHQAVPAEPPARSGPGGPAEARSVDGSPRHGSVPAAQGEWEELGEDAVVAYLEALRGVPLGDAREVRIAYTPLHGVGAAVLLRAFLDFGFAAPFTVPEQCLPDPDFPTVAFPNPEEPGAMDLVLDLAERTGADLALANDPDADRCAVAVPLPGGGWRMLTGDEVGGLLAEHVLRHTSGADRLVATTIVSSSLLGRIAAAHGVRFAETLTGFKWIMKAGGPDDRLVFGYEEALGYSLGGDHGTPVRDKDGIGAALAVAALAADARRDGRTLLDLLDDQARRFGVHATAQLSVRVTDRSLIDEAVSRLRKAPPAVLGGRRVVRVDDLAAGLGGLPPTDGLRLTLDGGARVIVRPSGTEPKLKSYLEVLAPVDNSDVPAARARAAAGLEALKADLATHLAV